MSPPPPPPLPPNDPHGLEANGRYNLRGKPDAMSLIVFLNVVNAVTQILIGAVTFLAFSYASMSDLASSYAQHIYLCVIGYVLLMSQALLCLSPHAGWAHTLQHPQKKIIHITMQIMGSGLAIVGSIIRIVDENSVFQTAHGILGLVAMLLAILSLIGGVLNFMCQKQFNPLLIKTIHGCTGSITISIAFICLCLGFTNYYRITEGDINANLAVSVTIFALGGILISTCSTIIRRIIFGE